MNKLKKKLVKNFLEKNDKQENEFQQTCLNFLDTIDQHIDAEEKIKLKEKFEEIYGINNKTYDITKFKEDCENIIYRQIVIPVFKNKFFLLTDFAPVDHCFYQSIVEALFEIIKEKHDGSIKELAIDKNQISYFYNFKSKKELFYQIKLLKNNYGNRFCLSLNISDFYSRIYQHRLENILRYYLQENNQHQKNQNFENQFIDTLITILNSVNKKQSYGIPIGPSCSKKLAEILLFSLDLEFLKLVKRIFIEFLNNDSGVNIIYYRYSDTYFLIFQETSSNILKYIKEFLTEIVDIFLKNYNFNIQSSKSEIIKLNDFLKKLNEKENLAITINNIFKLENDDENIFYESIHKIDNYQIIEIIKNLEIKSDDHLKQLYKYFSYYQIHILDLWFRKARQYLENLKQNNSNEKIKNILEFIETKSNTNYKFYQLMIDQLIIDYGDESQFLKIKAEKIEKTIENFYYPNYLFKRYQKFPELEGFFSERMAYTEFNTWKKIGYLIFIPKMTRNTRESEFNFIDFQKEKNTGPFLNFN